MVDLLAPNVPISEVFNGGEFTTPQKALATARRLGAIGGGAVRVQEQPSTSVAPKGTGVYVIYFAAGQSVNAAIAEFKLSNNPDTRSFDLGPAREPIGVSNECDEREYHRIRERLALCGDSLLAPQRGGVIGKGGLDTEVSSLDDLASPPFAAGGPLPMANYVIQLQNGTVVNAAFIGYMLENFGSAGARAFADTRRRLVQLSAANIPEDISLRVLVR